MLLNEQALILLLTIASQPKKLLLLGNDDSVQRTRSSLCWNVAEVVALRFAELARRNASVLASSSHLFLDHLHGIASATMESELDGKYPSHILDLLCSTMALLTKKERGIYSLLMITIQKQLASRVGAAGLGQDQQSFRLQSGHSYQNRSSAAELKQLMAVFLTGHLLRNQVVVDSRDRKSLANWMLRLLTSANRDETLLHVMHFVRDEISRTRQVSSLEQERTLLMSAISQLFRKKGLSWTPYDEVFQRTNEDSTVIITFDSKQKRTPGDTESLATRMVVDTTEFVTKMRFGVPSPSFRNTNTHECEIIRRLTEHECLTKICLLREIFHCYLDFATPVDQEEIVDAAFLFPASYNLALDDKARVSVELSVLHNIIWNLVCALDISVASTNFAAKQYSEMVSTSKSRHDCMKQFARMTARLCICLEQHDQLERILTSQKSNIQAQLSRFDGAVNVRHGDTQKQELEWLLLEVVIVERLLNGQLRRVQRELPRASLFGLEFRVICLAFEGQRKCSLETAITLPHELKLLQIFNQHLQFDVIHSVGVNDGNATSICSSNKKSLAENSEGHQAVKWLCHRAAELTRSVGNEEEYGLSGSAVDEDFEVGSTDTGAANIVTRNLMAHCLGCIYQAFTIILDECHIASAAGDSKWTKKMMELLAGGSNPDEDISSCDNPHGYNETFFRFLARQSLELTDPTLTCLALDVLASLVLNTKKSSLVGQLCQAVLHQTFPSVAIPSQFESEPENFFGGLPIKSLPNAVVSPSKGRICSLAKYRFPSIKWRHIAYLVVGSWAFSNSASAAISTLAQYLEEMQVLIDAAAPRENKNLYAKINGSENESNEDDLEEKHRQDDLAVVIDGEHVVLKSLTNESMPYFLEAILICAIASMYRAAPRKSSAHGLFDSNPFSDYCRAMKVFDNALRIFAQAEASGFNLPVKTNLLVLRGGAFAAKSARNIITKCIAWRVEQLASDDAGALGHLSVLFGAAYAMSATMELVTSTFQERVVLKMQRSGSGRKQGGWASELLAKTYGKKYNTRRWISKTEAKLLPFFSHGIQELQDYLEDQSIVLQAARAEWERSESILSSYERRDVMLSDDRLVSACRTLQPNELRSMTLKDWRLAVSVGRDDDETDIEYDDDQEVDEELLSEDEDDDADGFVVKSCATTPENGASGIAGSVLTGRKKQAVELQDNEDMGFPTIMVNFKKQKRHMS
ncbi:unnamed protein product [Phytophthora fragariaefolia]|uniref:Unnamed protein product n=1 Tax=Phytophthora fragariaefolia TaxID=1490495 RepID=A0A9W6UFR6_9STRA|nr:unnamed protein product [Phytophthora fragariaefolia]